VQHDPDDLASFVMSTLEEKRAEDIVWLDVSGVTDLARYFIIATVTNPRQMAAVAAACEKERKSRGFPRIGIEGASSGSSWVVLDYADVIVHLFLPEQREYYALEHLWADAKRMN
jgi:ribosome-associated protein